MIDEKEIEKIEESLNDMTAVIESTLKGDKVVKTSNISKPKKKISAWEDSSDSDQ